ncbi:MAG: glycosyltransferase family 2 protein [Elusimicrobia bacterium]|nr:glycosyltransferase family 2 protein [Elusimicrobiota bacterium]
MNPVYTIVVPLYNEEEVLPVFYQNLTAVLKNLEGGYEIIFVDDGSNDQTASLIGNFHLKDPSVKLIRFSRNFGHQIAFTAGLDHAQGQAIITMDGDLQHPPEFIPKLVAKWREGFDIVYTKRDNPEGAGYFKEWAIKTVYRLINLFGGAQLEYGMADFRLIDRRALEPLLKFEERQRFLRGLISWVGFRSTTIVYQVRPRLHGRSKYTFMKLANLAINGIFSFSYYPIRVVTAVGLGLSLLGAFLAFDAVYRYYFTDTAPVGWTSIMVGIFLIGGMQLTFLGIIGEYIGRIYEEVKRRPLYIVDSRLGFQNHKAAVNASVDR